MAGTKVSQAAGDLVLNRVSKYYGDFSAVDDLSLTVPDGSFFALLGPSGCGKTTTLRMIAGLEEPSQGTIQIGSTDITTEKPYRRNVNTVFQNYALFPHLSIFENVAFGLRRRGIKDVKEEVEKIAQYRESRCNRCEHMSKNVERLTSTKMGRKDKFCTDCGCNIHLATRSMAKGCPLGSETSKFPNEKPKWLPVTDSIEEALAVENTEEVKAHLDDYKIQLATGKINE